ncbi:hypothetical protein N9414_19989 [Nodularia spumigena CCY9414]|nr:hypothetical protein N9414_19989 [Nodularia spumigena CCY9414]
MGTGKFELEGRLGEDILDVTIGSFGNSRSQVIASTIPSGFKATARLNRETALAVSSL